MRAASMGRALLTAVVAFAASALPTTADAAVVLITDACHDVITGAGFYRVATATLNCPDDGITISASNVVLDLGGRVIDGNGTGHTGVLVASGKKNVVVQNGAISGFQVGVSAG